MLIDGAIRFAETARTGMEDDNHEATYTGVSRCQKILLELIGSLAPEQAPDLCEKVSALYTYMYTRMMRASSERDIGIIDEVLRLLRYERETWVMLMKELTTGGGGATEALPTPAQPAPPSSKVDSLVGGRVSVEG